MTDKSWKDDYPQLAHLEPGDIAVTAISPLKHIWQVGKIKSITVNGLFCFYCGDRLFEQNVYAHPHEVRLCPNPEDMDIGDQLKGDIHKHSVLKPMVRTIRTVWIEATDDE